MLTRLITFYFAKRHRATCCFLQHLTAFLSTSEGRIIRRIWHKALEEKQPLPSPAGLGWKMRDDTLRPLLMTKEPAPPSILELTYCQCLRFFCTKNCSCRSNGLACTEACRCMTDGNCLNPNKSCSYDSDDELDGVTEIDVDD